jgi:hypothetical protein
VRVLREVVIVLVIGSGIWAAMSTSSLWQVLWLAGVVLLASLELFPARTP